MPVTLKDVEHIARLARLEFSEEEKVKLAGQLNRILEHIDKLNELDTKNVEPLSHPVDLSGVPREDRVKNGLSTEEALANAPEQKKGFFKVPKVIGE